MKSLILHIETSGKTCSVALSNDNELLYTEILREERSHAAGLSGLIDNVLRKENKKISELNAVAVSEGPGSYTGLRIGVSVAKAICYAAELPLISVPTLEILVAHVIRHAEKWHFDISDEDLLVPMIDARRMEVYQAIYNNKFEKVEKVSPLILDESSYSGYLKNKNLVFFGNGSEKCQNLISHSNAVFFSNIEPEAKDMISLAIRKFNKSDFEDSAYFEPFYLKEFYATKPKKNIL